MAVLKDLIVHGNSRFINAAQFNSLAADKIASNEGVFNKLIATNLTAEQASITNLTATNAKVVGILDVTKGELHTSKWTNANMSNVGGSFYVSPTVNTTIDSGNTPMSITFGGSANSRTIQVTGGAFVTDAVKTYNNGSTSTITWSVGSHVMVTGSVRLDTTGVDYPLGTLTGYLTSAITSGGPSALVANGFTIGEVSSAALETIISEIGTNNIKSYDISISMFEIGPKSTLKPVGIMMTSYGVDKSTYIDIYGGVNTKNTTATNNIPAGYTEPNVRIGYLGGIPSYTDSAGTSHKPTGWGLYTDNGYFKGVVVANSGVIGGTSIDATSLYSNKDEYSYYKFYGDGKFELIDGELGDQERAYIKFNEVTGSEESTSSKTALQLKLNELEINVGKQYGVEKTINVIDVIAQQLDFIELWNGFQTWIYTIYNITSDITVVEDKTYYSRSGTSDNYVYTAITQPTGNPNTNGYYEAYDYTVYAKSDTEGQITYYYDAYQFNTTQSYMRSSDTTVDTDKEYYQYTNSSYTLISNPSGNPYNNNYYELITGIYNLSNDTTVDTRKNYYTRSGSSPNYLYTYVASPSGNPHSNSYYEFIEEEWIQLSKTFVEGDPEDETSTGLPSIDAYGLQQSLKYTFDDDGNLQRLVVSSASEDSNGADKAWVEIDKYFLNFAIHSEYMQPLELKLQYDGDKANTASINILHGEEVIFDIKDNNNYMLNSKTGFKLGGLGIFNYKNGLAIGIV